MIIETNYFFRCLQRYNLIKEKRNVYYNNCMKGWLFCIIIELRLNDIWNKNTKTLQNTAENSDFRIFIAFIY
jgi:hypothetical protein